MAWRLLASTVLVAGLVGCGEVEATDADGGPDTPDAVVSGDANCGGDADGDGLADCVDDDDDGDGLRDTDETARGTDPATPTLLVEIDYMVDGAGGDYRPTRAVLTLTEDSFAAAGIEVVLEVDPGGALSRLSPLTAAADMESIASASKDQGASHVHVVMADTGAGTRHGTAHYAVPNSGGSGNAPAPGRAAAFVFAGQILADAATYQSQFSAWGITADHLVARSLIHELGHLIGCTHESTDPANVMAQNSLVGAVNSTNQSRWQDAALGVGRPGHPTFLADSIAQIDLTHKPSADIGTSAVLRRFDFGPAGGAVYPGAFAVTPATTYDRVRGYGWVGDAPTQAGTAGSDATDDRYADNVAGDPAVQADTVFRIDALGSHTIRVFARVGKTGGADRSVRCEIRHPTQGTGWFTANLTATNTSRGYWFNPVWPVAPAGASFARSHIELRCLDDATRDDAPIEYVELEKLDP